MDSELDSLRRLRSLTRRYAPIWLDHESLASDLWLEEHVRGVRFTNTNVRRRVITLVKRERKHTQLSYEPHATSAPIPRLDTLLSSLPPEQGRLIWMRFYQDQTIREMALSLNQSTHHVETLLAKTLSQLRQLVNAGLVDIG